MRIDDKTALKSKFLNVINDIQKSGFYNQSKLFDIMASPSDERMSKAKAELTEVPRDPFFVNGRTGDLIEMSAWDGGVRISMIQVTNESRQGQGVGTKMMEMLLSSVDRQGLSVRLDADPQFVGDDNRNRLVSFYERFGFVVEGDISKYEPDEEVEMYRPSQPPALRNDLSTNTKMTQTVIHCLNQVPNTPIDCGTSYKDSYSLLSAMESMEKSDPGSEAVKEIEESLAYLLNVAPNTPVNHPVIKDTYHLASAMHKAKQQREFSLESAMER